MISISMISTITRSAVVTKVIDTLIINKLDAKKNEKKWLQTNKLELFSKLSEEILFFNDDDIEIKKRSIKSLCAKSILLSNNKKFIFDINILNIEIDQNKIIKNNDALIHILKKELLL